MVLGLLLGAAFHLDHSERGQVGREEFLQKQAARFDKHFAKSNPLALDLAVCVFIMAAGIGVYELLAFGVSRALKKTDESTS